MMELSRTVILAVLLYVVRGQPTIDQSEEKTEQPCVILDSQLQYVMGEVNSLKAEMENASALISQHEGKIALQEEKMALQEGKMALQEGKIALQEERIALLESMKTVQGATVQCVPAHGFTARMDVTDDYRPNKYIPVSFTDVLVNEGGGYNPDTSTYTCPVAGLYIFTMSIYSRNLKYGSYWRSFAELIHSSSGSRSAVARMYSATEDPDHYTFTQTSNSAVIRCLAGDTVWVSTWWNQGNQMYGATEYPYTIFSGVLVSTL